MWNVIGGVLVGAVALAVAQKYIEEFMQRGRDQGSTGEGGPGGTKLPKQAKDVVPRTGAAAQECLNAAKRVLNKARK